MEQITEREERAMHAVEALKGEITAELDELPLASLRTLADFVAFLRSRSRKADHRGQSPKGDREAVERYVAGYQEHPETDEEVAVTYAMSRETLAGESWE